MLRGQDCTPISTLIVYLLLAIKLLVRLLLKKVTDSISQVMNRLL